MVPPGEYTTEPRPHAARCWCAEIGACNQRLECSVAHMREKEELADNDGADASPLSISKRGAARTSETADSCKCELCSTAQK